MTFLTSKHRKLDMDHRFSDILERAGEVYQRFGIRSVSMDDLSRRLGISKKTLYTHVSNKEELVEQVMIHRHQQDQRNMEALKPGSGNAIDFLLEMSRKVCLRLIHINPAMIYDLQKYYPDILDQIIHMHHQYYSELFKKNLEEGIKEGLYRQDINKDLTIKLYIGNMQNFFGEELSSLKEMDASDIFRVMFGNHIRSIVSPEGLTYFKKKEMALDYNID